MLYPVPMRDTGYNFLTKKAEVRAAQLKDDAVKILKKSLPMQLYDYNAMLQSYNPDTPLMKYIPRQLIARGMQGAKKHLGLLGGLAAILGVGVMGYRYNKGKNNSNSIIDAIQKADSLEDVKLPFSVEKHELADDVTEKSASLTGRSEVREIMQKIYNEDPSYWPYGLGISGHQSVYLIRDNMTKAAAGFVGWQEQMERGKKIGSYSIGILPEYRGNGFAKEAVAKIIQKKAARVDEVRSYVCSHNNRSKGLAKTLNITVHEDF